MGNSGLETTLRQLGIKDLSPAAYNVLIEGTATEEENQRVYDYANRTLLEYIGGDRFGECIHVTGEARALGDPLHRYVCRAVAESYEHRIKMVCYVPRLLTPDRLESTESWRQISRKAFDWMSQTWTARSWRDYVDAMDLMADGDIELYVLPKKEGMHFSVFLDRFVLLQAKHPHGAATKDVWFLESSTLHAALSSIAHQVVAKARKVPTNGFRDMSLSLGSPRALHILFRLRDEGGLEKHVVQRELTNIGADWGIVPDLESAGFIEKDDGFLRATRSGVEYLSCYDRMSDEDGQEETDTRAMATGTE